MHYYEWHNNPMVANKNQKMKTIFGLPLVGELLTLSIIVFTGTSAATCFSAFSNIEKIRILEADDRAQVESWNAERERRRQAKAITPAVAHLPKLSTTRDPS